MKCTALWLILIEGYRQVSIYCYVIMIDYIILLLIYIFIIKSV